MDMVIVRAWTDLASDQFFYRSQQNRNPNIVRPRFQGLGQQRKQHVNTRKQHLTPRKEQGDPRKQHIFFLMAEQYKTDTAKTTRKPAKTTRTPTKTTRQPQKTTCEFEELG